MKKREKILAVLVLGSLMQMSVCYAADYDGKSEYVQGTDIKFDKMKVTDVDSPKDIYIGNKDGSTQSITIGNENDTSREYALIVNDPNQSYVIGGTSEQIIHNVTLNAQNITVVGSRGLLLGSREGEDASSLTIKGKTFTVDAKSNDTYGGLKAGGFATLKIGDKDNWLDKVTIKGGNGFSISPVGQNLGGVKDRYAEINAKDVLFDSTEANKSNGTAFSNSESTVVVNADTITVKGKKTESGTYGVLNVHGSQTDFNARNINIVADKEQTDEKEKNKLYAIQATDNTKNPGSPTYELNLTATEKLNINGNVLLDYSGTTNMVGREIVITGTNISTDANDGIRGSAVNLRANSKLNLGTENAKAGSVIISSAGEFGILLGDAKSSSGHKTTLYGNVAGLFSATAKEDEGCGIKIRNECFFDVNAGSFNASGKKMGLEISGAAKVDIVTDSIMKIEATNGTGMDIIGRKGVNYNLTSTKDNIHIIGTDSGLVASSDGKSIFTAEQGNIIIEGDNSEALSTDGNYWNIKNKVRPQTTIELNAQNGVVAIKGSKKGVLATAFGSDININGAVQIDTTGHTEGKDYAIAAGGKGYYTTPEEQKKYPRHDCDDALHGAVNITMTGDKDSNIVGDIIASAKGEVNIKGDASYTGTLNVKGNILAAQRSDNPFAIADVNIDFGKNGVFEGRTDDYRNLQGKGTELLDIEVDDAGVINLTFGEGSTWKMTGDSYMNNLVANKSNIDMTADNKAFSSLYTNEFTGNGNTIHMDIDAATNKDNSDRVYVDGTHSGNHYITLNNVGANTDGAEGTVLVSVKDEQGTFKANDSEGTLYWNKYKLNIKDSAEQNYKKDWYLEKVEIITPDEKPTTSVDTVMSVNSLNYHTWRTENDKLLQRMGELRHNGEEEKGAWFRVKGSKIGYDGEFENKYTTYELGYDEVTKRTEDMVRYQGAALSYVDGDSSYNNGSGDNHGKSIGFYTTEQYSKGHYLDLVFKISNMDNDFKVFDTNGNKITGEYDNTGVSISAEYGRKNDLDHGWYIEPQAQLTLGYMGGANYETSNGISVDQSGIKSALGRIGFNVGKKIGEKGIVYAKANLLHEFGGGYDVEMRAADGSLTMSNTYNDTWFEYGVGVAMATSDNSHIYFDVERSTGSDFYKDWQWNAGMRWNF